MSGIYTVVLVVHTILVLFLIGIVLLQRSESDGLSGLGGGGNQFLTGRSSANLLTRTTAILAGAFMMTSLILAIMISRGKESSLVDSITSEMPQAVEENVKQEAPVPAKAPEEPAVPKPE